MTDLLLSADWKDDSYVLILVIIDHLTEKVHYKLINVNINVPGLAKLIIDVVVQHHDLSDSIINDQKVIFTFKLWSLLCYFLASSDVSSPHFTLRQTGRQNNKIA